MANHEVEHRIRIAVRLCGVTAEYVEDGPPIVTTRRNLTVAVVIGLTPRIRQPLYLEAISRSNQPKIWIGVATADFKVQLRLRKPRLEPILEVKLLILAALAANQLVRLNRLNAPGEDFKAWVSGWHIGCIPELQPGVKPALSSTGAATGNISAQPYLASSIHSTLLSSVLIRSDARCPTPSATLKPKTMKLIPDQPATCNLQLATARLFVSPLQPAANPLCRAYPSQSEATRVCTRLVKVKKEVKSPRSRAGVKPG